MIKAQHVKLAYSTNATLMLIRDAELQYYVQFFSTIGLQCAFIGAYQIALLSQAPVRWNNVMEYGAVLCYWITSVIGILLGFFGLLVSIYITVFGQYLALRGPSGSIVRAIEGFREYQSLILTTFSSNMLVLVVSCVFQFLLFMPFVFAMGLSAVVVVSGWVWYHFCLKIYNKLHFNHTPDKGEFRDNNSSSGRFRSSESCDEAFVASALLKKADSNRLGRRMSTSERAMGKLYQPTSELSSISEGSQHSQLSSVHQQNPMHVHERQQRLSSTDTGGIFGYSAPPRAHSVSSYGSGRFGSTASAADAMEKGSVTSIQSTEAHKAKAPLSSFVSIFSLRNDFYKKIAKKVGIRKGGQSSARVSAQASGGGRPPSYNPNVVGGQGARYGDSIDGPAAQRNDAGARTESAGSGISLKGGTLDEPLLAKSWFRKSKKN